MVQQKERKCPNLKFSKQIYSHNHVSNFSKEIFVKLELRISNLNFELEFRISNLKILNEMKDTDESWCLRKCDLRHAFQLCLSFFFFYPHFN